MVSAIVVVALAALAATADATSPTTLVSQCEAVTPETAVCVRQANATLVLCGHDDPNVVDLARQHISAIEGLPPRPYTIDLSFNDLAAVNIGSAALVNVSTLNLGGNVITPSGLASLPATITSLDLSGNSIDHLDGTTFNWTQLPLLTTLNLSSNGLRQVHFVSFPASLTTLDLTNNTWDELIVDAATFVRWNDASFHLRLDMTDAQVRQVTSRCVHGSVVDFVGQHGVACVTSPSSPTPTKTATTVSMSGSVDAEPVALTTLLLNLGLAMCMAVTTVFVATQIVRYRIRQDELTNRDTFISSEYDD